MKHVHVKMIGSGTLDDPLRADMPTYTLVAHDPSTKQAIVEVPDEDVPAGLTAVSYSPTWAGGKAIKVLRLKAADKSKWNDAIRSRYSNTHSKWDVDDAVEPEE